MTSRRRFLAAGVALGMGPWRGRSPQRRTPVIDGLGEVRSSYGSAVLDAMRASGLSGCVVTAGNPALQGAAAHADMVRELEEYRHVVAAQPSRLEAVTDAAGIERATAAGRIGLLYYIQNATPIEDDVSRLDDLTARGIRLVQLTYNSRNLLGDGCLERTNAGLSRFGLEVVAGLNARRMLVDLSHCGDATTLDGITHSRAPVAITHAGCRAVFDHPRNKTDGAIRALADRGGVIGIFQINPYLGPAERNTLEDVMRHVDHAIRVGGVEHVGIGSDREYATIPDTPEEQARLREELSRLRPTTAAGFRWPFFVSALNHPRRMETLADALRKRGRTPREVDLILGGNFLRLFRETIG
jgi:membrane dipeptidase